ncbi:MAG TPA: hypothetical protein PLM75_13015, partial [bacterium]|nr:hypothetical protein [bacterium]
MKNIILLFLGLDKSVDTTNMKTTQSIVAEKIYNEKTLAELFILKIKQLKNIDEIILLGYDYSEIPFSSKESLTQSALVKEICKSNEIKYIEYDFKYSLSNYWTNFEKAQEYTVSKFNEFANINDNLIQIYDNNYFFDIELLEQMIANHIEKNAELTHSTDLRLNYFTILKWNNSLKFENINEFLPTSAFVNKYQFFRLPKNKIDDIDLFKISFNKTNKNVIDFKDFFEFYLKNK